MTGAGVLRAACVQMNTRQDVDANLASALDLVEAAADMGARLVALPETWAYKGTREGILGTAEPEDGPSNSALAELAARRRVWLLAGSIYVPSSPGHVTNTSVLFGPGGEPRARYSKMHLFDIATDTAVYLESDHVTPGAEPVTTNVETDEATATLGMTICYDLRFPELYRSLALRGADVFAVPSAFTAYTGSAHWEVLLRARAVENGCFVLAPDQVGTHLPGRDCWGHSMIVDPWGTVLAVADDGVGVCVADLDLGRLADVRRQIPTLEHRRPAAYDL